MNIDYETSRRRLRIARLVVWGSVIILMLWALVH